MGNIWPYAPTLTITDTSNLVVFGLYIMPAMPAGIKIITVDFDASIQGFNPAFQEWAGIAAGTGSGNSIFDGTPTSNFNIPNPIASGSITTAVANSIVFQFAQSTDFGSDASGFHNGFQIYNANTGTFIQTDPQNAGYFSQQQIQTVAGAVNPSANVVPAPGGAYGFATHTFALKTDPTIGTLGPVGTRVIGIHHLRLNGSGAVTANYAVQWPTYGNLLVGGCSDPASTISITGVVGNVSGTWSVVNVGTNQAASLVYKDHSANSSTGEVLSVQLHDLAAHNYVQGCWYDVANGGNFDNSNFLTGSTTFGPGNSTPNVPITPGVNTGITIVQWGISSGPPDSVVNPANAILDSAFYTGYTDPSSMDNGDFFGHFVFANNAVQNWILHDTVSTTGFGATLATFNGPLPANDPIKFYANGAFQANAIVEGGLSTGQGPKLFANVTAQINNIVEVSSPATNKMYANGQLQTTQIIEFLY